MEPINFLNNIVGRHGNTVALLFQRYGYNAPVNPDTLIQAFIAKGEEFINDLIAAGVADDPAVVPDLSLFFSEEVDRTMSSFLGIGEKKDKSNTDDKGFSFKSAFNNIAQIVTGVSVIANSLKKNNDGPPASSSEDEDKKEEKTILGMPTALFFGIIAVIVLAVVLFLIKKK